MKKIPIGISNFKDIIQKNYYFVDKSIFIKDIIDDGSEAILIPRPRRFGKTLNMTMLQTFFEITEEDNSVLFKDLEIHKYKDIMMYQGKYPVISITFKDQKHMEWDVCMQGFKRLVISEFKRHDYILEDEKLKSYEKKEFLEILSGKAETISYVEGLKTLSEFLYRYHGKKVIILIDEYDIPLQESYLNKYYNEAVSFMRNFLSAGLKDNPYLEKGILTGILRVAKESIFSGLNNIKVYNLLSSFYNKYFGFTEEEVEEILSYYKIHTEIQLIKTWYNGYNFGGRTIYNPWSILNYVKDAAHNFIAYWANTSSNDLIRDMLKNGTASVKEELEALIRGEKLIKIIDENIVMNEINESTENLWSFLLFSGYLRAVKTEIKDGRTYCTLDIPNNEVKYIYEEIIRKWFKERVNNDEFSQMLKALTIGDMENFEMMFQDIVESTLSYFDTSGESERFYHAFVLGMLVSLKGTHDVKSNRESGYGRYDVMIIPKDKSKLGIIIEFKKVNKRKNETIEEAAQTALKQIKDKKYDVEMKEFGIKDILELGIVFSGKEVLVREN